jgi:hypothetical protein
MGQFHRARTEWDIVRGIEDNGQMIMADANNANPAPITPISTKGQGTTLRGSSQNHYSSGPPGIIRY